MLSKAVDIGELPMDLTNCTLKICVDACSDELLTGLRLKP